MKKKHFLGFTLLAIMGISALATTYPLQTFVVGAILFPVCFVWSLYTTDKRSKDKCISFDDKLYTQKKNKTEQ